MGRRNWITKHTEGNKILHTILVKHYNDFLCYTRFCQIFPEIPVEIFFKNWHNKKCPNLQVYEHTPAKPTTPSIKVVIVML